MKNFLKILFLGFLCIMMLGACSTRTSDSGFTQKTVGRRIDSNIYVLNVTMLADPFSNKNIGGEGVSRQYSDIYGFFSKAKNNDPYFVEFVNALYKHTKDREVDYAEDMAIRFLDKINNLKKKQNPLIKLNTKNDVFY